MIYRQNLSKYSFLTESAINIAFIVHKDATVCFPASQKNVEKECLANKAS